MKKKIVMYFILLLSLLACRKEALFFRISGEYVLDCNFTYYNINHTGIYDSSVTHRTLITELYMQELGGFNKEYSENRLEFNLPSYGSKNQVLERDLNYSGNILRFENYYERVPDGEPDTLSIEFNQNTQEILLEHKGYVNFLFPGDTAFKSIFYYELCTGVKDEDLYY